MKMMGAVSLPQLTDPHNRSPQASIRSFWLREVCP
jgi:hypothetical protein